jgi:uncharacterized membrane protein
LNYLKVFVLSAMPIVEIRGGLPLGMYLGLSRWEALFVSVLGNIAIIFPLLWVLTRIEKVLAMNKYVRRVYDRMVRKAEGKRESFRRFGKYALFLFVAIPLPTTGAWTACVAARLFKIPDREAFVIITLGVIASGLLVMAKVVTITGLAM